MQREAALAPKAPIAIRRIPPSRNVQIGNAHPAISIGAALVRYGRIRIES